METTAHEDAHAGELEASILLAAWPSYLRDGWQNSWGADDHLHDDRRNLITVGIDAYAESGIIGRPSLATEAKGHKALQVLGQNAVKTMAILTNGSPSQWGDAVRSSVAPRAANERNGRQRAATARPPASTSCCSDSLSTALRRRRGPGRDL